MSEYNSIEEISKKIKDDLNNSVDKKSIALLFAFNATWKTRLSVELNSLNEEDTEKFKVLSYNAFLEDLFSWDNDNYVLEFKSHWVIEFIKEQDLEKNIIDNFINITHSKIEPVFDFELWTVSFIIATWDENNENIKVSKSEESILIWSIFYSILEVAIEALNTENKENRIADDFDYLDYVVIDDPVSSIDDGRIISIAMKLFETIKSSTNKKLNFLITTHHALFYNILFNSFKRLSKAESKKHFYILSKNSNNIYELLGQNDDTPFAYHLLIKNKIKDAIDNNNIEKYHFNLFRSLLEKTANFLGYNSFSDCILWERKDEFNRVINLYSHGKISELETSSVSNQHKELFKETFNEFISNFKYN
jgi:hypothetical protein